MPLRLHITLLKDDDRDIPDKPGHWTTLRLPYDLPQMADVHQHALYIFYHADLLIHIIQAARTLFPCDANPAPLKATAPHETD